MAVYRCLQSGNTVEFTLPHDIESMKGHSGYERIDVKQEGVNEDVMTTRFNPVFQSTSQKGKPGRPRKSA